MSRVRIVGGVWRSRLLNVSAVPGLRPTPDRVRETLFNWLGQDLSGLDCLDLFAGSGVLGFEAASRGAASVTLIEQNPRAFAALQAGAKQLGGEERLELLRADALKFLARTERRYDVVFLDPPYHQGWIERVLPLLPRVLKPQALVYAEAEHELAQFEGWERVRGGQAGQVHFNLLRVREA